MAWMRGTPATATEMAPLNSNPDPMDAAYQRTTTTSYSDAHTELEMSDFQTRLAKKVLKPLFTEWTHKGENGKNVQRLRFLLNSQFNSNLTEIDAQELFDMMDMICGETDQQVTFGEFVKGFYTFYDSEKKKKKRWVWQRC